MRIPIQLITLLHTLKVIDSSTLVDSGADTSCIDWQIIRKHQLSTKKLTSSIAVHNVDQTVNKTGAIQYTYTLYTNIEGIAQKHLFYVMGYRQENIIFGLPWLWVTNSTIDWARQTLTILKSCDQSKELYSAHTTDTQQHNSFFWKPLPCTHQYVNVNTVYDSCLHDYLDQDMEDQYLQHSLKNWLINRILWGDCKCFLPNSPVIAKLTTATELAIATEKAKPKVSLLSEYTNYTQVISKEVTDHVPPPQPYDYKIDLDGSFTSKIGKIYPLFPDKKKATEDFLEENIAAGKICLSNSLQASPFFFVKKKNGKLHPCQDYRYFNEHTNYSIYYFPLISDLVDKLKDACHFTKFDVHWRYNNMWIKDGHQWKAAFITHKGLCKLAVMFFSLCNSPAMFQWFMNDSFRDMIAEGWLIIYMDDLLIVSSDLMTHAKWTCCVLQHMTELDLHLKLEKCQFNISKIEYLGMIVKPGQLTMDPVKLDSIVTWPTSTKVKKVHSFLSFVNFYH